MADLIKEVTKIAEDLGLFVKKQEFPGYDLVLVVQLGPQKFVEIKIPKGKKRIDVGAAIKFPPDFATKVNTTPPEKVKEFFYVLKRDLNYHPVSFTLLPPKQGNKPTPFPPEGIGVMTTILPEELSRPSLKSAIDLISRAIFTVLNTLEYYFMEFRQNDVNLQDFV